ncbi:hypothetical protein [Thalassoglobus polymorphus]|uniref:Uncharacterized protein n=1 Tax=Thalassoglobus polymorphus TaxID=2527994 RepID=A0A517QHG3_9PLAN|nr:hypothetical protein [Thalassoglobus polymorphus]QDT30997.1 hypothetical protein Mal48_02270 [Thalassoglobus polymorphus]
MNRHSRTPEAILRTSQLIAAALIVGVVAFCGVAFFAVGGMNVASDGTLVSAIMAAVTLPQIVMFFFVSAFVTEQVIDNQYGRRSIPVTPENKPYQVMQMRTIIGFALLEGGCFMNIVAYILEKNWWSLGIVGTLVLFMLTNFPTKTRFKHYAESQQAYS